MTQFFVGMTENSIIKETFRTNVLGSIHRFKDYTYDEFCHELKELTTGQEALSLDPRLKAVTTTNPRSKVSAVTNVCDQSSTCSDLPGPEIPELPSECPIKGYDMKEVVRWQYAVNKIMKEKLCYNCKEEGHFIAECPHLGDPKKGFYRPGVFRHKKPSVSQNSNDYQQPGPSRQPRQIPQASARPQPSEQEVRELIENQDMSMADKIK